jgi:hypothetical protein
LTLVAGGFLIPLTIIIVSYTFILIKLSKRGRHVISGNGDKQSYRLQPKQLTVYYFLPATPLNDEQFRSETASIFETNEGTAIARNIRRTEARATRTALLVCAVYCLAWGPYASMAIVSQLGFDHLINVYTTATLSLFTKTAACINPLIYVLSSSRFRQQICFYINYLCTCRSGSYPLSLSTYDLNRKHLTTKYNGRFTQSDLSQQ